MLTAILPDRPVSAASATEMARPAAREQAVPPVAASAAIDSANVHDYPGRRREEQREKHSCQRPENGAIFAAAVLTGTLMPRPETLTQLYTRIGTSVIPEEYEIHLRNLTV